MPAGVMPAYSRLTTMKPLDIGSMPEMHSKQPQEDCALIREILRTFVVSKKLHLQK